MFWNVLCNYEYRGRVCVCDTCEPGVGCKSRRWRSMKEEVAERQIRQGQEDEFAPPLPLGQAWPLPVNEIIITSLLAFDQRRETSDTSELLTACLKSLIIYATHWPRTKSSKYIIFFPYFPWYDFSPCRAVWLRRSGDIWVQQPPDTQLWPKHSAHTTQTALSERDRTITSNPPLVNNTHSSMNIFLSLLTYFILIGQSWHFTNWWQVNVPQLLNS